jgi:hypothetical protein
MPIMPSIRRAGRDGGGRGGDGGVVAVAPGRFVTGQEFVVDGGMTRKMIYT